MTSESESRERDDAGKLVDPRDEVDDAAAPQPLPLDEPAGKSAEPPPSSDAPNDAAGDDDVPDNTGEPPGEGLVDPRRHERTQPPIDPPLPVVVFLALSLGLFASAAASAADWNGWRGSQRNGTAAAEVSLRRSLPPQGLEPVWMNTEDVEEGGGWSSPVVAGGRVFLYSHLQSRRKDVALPEVKFPELTDEQKAAMSPEERQDYEQKRQEERRRRRALQFRYVDRILCLDAATGKPLWHGDRQSEQTQYRQSSTPAVSGGRVYYVGSDRKLVCLNAQDGKPLWARPLPVDQDETSPLSSSPLVVAGLVVVLTERLVALDADDGSLAWTAESRRDGQTYSSPVAWKLGETYRVIANSADSGAVCVDAENGKELWRVDSGGGRSSPVVSGEYLVTYAGSRKGGLRCYRLSDGPPELLWKYQRMADQGSSPLVTAGRVFIQGDRNFACIDLADGKPVWKTTLDRDRPRYTSPVSAGGLVFYTFGGVLCLPAAGDDYVPLFDARLNQQGTLAPVEYFREQLNIDDLEATREGREQSQKLWRRQIESSGPRDCVSPAIANGRLYLRINRGIVCYDLTADRSP